MKTKRAIDRETNKMITCTCEVDDKDQWGKAIWRTEDGKAYELKYAKLANKYFFVRYSHYDR